MPKRRAGYDPPRSRKRAARCPPRGRRQSLGAALRDCQAAMRPVLNLGEIVAAHARLLPDKIGTRDSRRALTFREWNARACKLANALLARGLKKGDSVALLAYNRVEWMEMYIGLAKAGLVAVPINFRLVTPEIHYIVEHSAAKAIIVQDDLAPQVEPLRGTLAIADADWIHIGDTTPAG